MKFISLFARFAALFSLNLLVVLPGLCQNQSSANTVKLGEFHRQSLSCLVRTRGGNALLRAGRKIRFSKIISQLDAKLRLTLRLAANSKRPKSLLGAAQRLRLLRRELRKCQSHTAPYNGASVGSSSSAKSNQKDASNSSSSVGSSSSESLVLSESSMSNASVVVCGNDLFETGEVCECGADGICGTTDDSLQGRTCASLGFISGTLACSSTCRRLDTSNCVLPPAVYLYVDNDGGDGLQSGCSDNFSRTENSAAKPFCTIQKAADLTIPGDTVLVRGGIYSGYGAPLADNHNAVFLIRRSGVTGLPITYKNYGGERVIIDAKAQTVNAIEVGHYNAGISVHDIVLDGFEATRARGDGVFLFKPEEVIVRNCQAYQNNALFWSLHLGNSYAAGIASIGGRGLTVERCRVFQNGNGISFWEEDMSSVTPVGARDSVIKDNFIYGNSWAGNYNDAAGLGSRFGEDLLIQGNVMWDNPDGGLAGLGVVNSKFIGNAAIYNWQPGGNNYGWKPCVRGGGGNLLAFNVLAYNGGNGIDLATGIGDLVINNTVFRNGEFATVGAWGILAEGWDSLLFNNISHSNWLAATGTIPRDLGAGKPWVIYKGSDYNLFGSVYWGFNPSQGRYDLTGAGDIELHSFLADPELNSPGFPVLSYDPSANPDPTRLIHPEQVFADANHDGVVTIEEARADIANHFMPHSSSAAKNAGLSLGSIQTAALAAIPELITVANNQIQAWQSRTDAYAMQAKNAWNQIVIKLNQPDHAGYADLTNLSDFAGNPVPLDQELSIGAVQ